MSMWRWQKIRRADILPELRQRFEFYGETLLTLASASEPNAHALGLDLRTYLAGNAKRSSLGFANVATWTRNTGIGSNS